jgi:dihydrofolate synthase / folylpolyglutamate synthase
MQSIDNIVARLLGLHPTRIDLSLDRMRRLLAALDHPERKLPPAIHVAGTNGKGSTVAFMRAILEAAGKSVHVYTSPELVRLNERYRIGTRSGGKLVSDGDLLDTLLECEMVNKGQPITIFEITTAAGFLLFARNPADIILLEVGLGGRLDATNVISHPLASVITPVSLDHTEYLGETIELVATEKAGILKMGAPGIIAAQTDEALRAIKRYASRIRASLKVQDEDWVVGEETGRMTYQDGDDLLDLPAPKLIGQHQFGNAGLAIAALRSIEGIEIPNAAFEAGLLNAVWPARMQRISHGDLLSMVPQGSEIWLDGGHNPACGTAIAATMADLEERVSRPLMIIVGLLKSKDLRGFLRNFVGLSSRIAAVPVPSRDECWSPDEIAAAAREMGFSALSCDNLESALLKTNKLNDSEAPRILVTGSLHLAGRALATNGTPPN